MAFDFYFAGTQCNEADEVMVSLNANVLKSYVNDQKSIQKWFEHKKNGWKGKLLIDNGAFTFHRHGGELDIDEYIKWINDNDEYIDYAIALDHIPGTWGKPRTLEDFKEASEKTWQNYLYMKERVKNYKKLLPVFHMSENFEYLRKYLALPDLEYICISGFKDLTNKQREEWYEKCFYEISHSNHPDIKVHCLGSATMSNAIKFPFTSMDATSWIMTGANGSILTDMGVVYLGKRTRLTEQEYKVVHEILDKYGYTVDDAIENYRVRVCANVHYLYDKSRNTDFNGGKFNRRRLF